MRDIALSRDLLNSNKILFHYGKILEEIAKGQTAFHPVAIEIHPTAVCNHRCIHCSYRERNESRASLSSELMDQLVRSIIEMNVRAVYFSGGGEPTLYPHLGEYIQKLHSNGVECSIITNGSCFERMGFVEIANQLNYIAVSLPGVDRDTFQTITGTDNLEPVLALPGKIKAAHGAKSPVVGARIVLTNKNYTGIDTLLRITRASGFDYALFKIVRDYEDNGQGLDQEGEKFLRERIGALGGLDDNFTNLKSIFNYRCLPEFVHKCWTNQYGLLANVSTDGRVYPNIVGIDKEEFCIGNLYEERLEDMWNGPRHLAVKEASNLKWSRGECRNCRAMAYNRIINEIGKALPAYFDPFI